MSSLRMRTSDPKFTRLDDGLFGMSDDCAEGRGR